MSTDHCQGIGGPIRTRESDVVSAYADHGRGDVLLGTANVRSGITQSRL